MEKVKLSARFGSDQPDDSSAMPGRGQVVQQCFPNAGVAVQHESSAHPGADVQRQFAQQGALGVSTDERVGWIARRIAHCTESFWALPVRLKGSAQGVVSE